MTRFAITTAVAAVVALSGVAANAADLRSDAMLNAPERAAVLAGDIYSNRELASAGLNASDEIAIPAREQVQFVAGDVFSSRELKQTAFDADTNLTLTSFSAADQADRGTVLDR